MRTQAAFKELKDKVTAAANTEEIIHRLGTWFENVGKVYQIVDFALTESSAPAEQVAAAKGSRKAIEGNC